MNIYFSLVNNYIIWHDDFLLCLETGTLTCFLKIGGRFYTNQFHLPTMICSSHGVNWGTIPCTSQGFPWFKLVHPVKGKCCISYISWAHYSTGIIFAVWMFVHQHHDSQQSKNIDHSYPRHAETSQGQELQLKEHWKTKEHIDDSSLCHCYFGHVTSWHPVTTLDWSQYCVCKLKLKLYTKRKERTIWKRPQKTRDINIFVIW